MIPIAAAALLVAGCGGSKSSAPTTTTAVAAGQPTAYVPQMRALGRTLGKTVDALYPLDSGTRGSAVSRASIARIEHARTIVEGVQRRLTALKPPARVAADQRHLQAGVAQLLVEMNRLAKALRTGDTDTFNSLSQLPALRLVTGATDAMVKHGYDVTGH